MFSAPGARTDSARSRVPAVPSPSNYVSTSHDQPCAAETRGKVAALRRLETGEKLATNEYLHAYWQHHTPVETK